MKRLREQRRGVTLMELLVVATIILIVTAVSIPTIKPMVESQLTKQAASTVSTYLNRARARAMATGRPCGVTFEYFDGTYDPTTGFGSASLVLRQVETPPYYSGLDQGASVDVYAEDDIYDGDRRLRQVRVTLDPVTGNLSDPYWNEMVGSERGAKIQFNGVGPYYPLTEVGGAFFIEKLPGVDLPVLRDATFKVVRDPRPTMTAPIGLPQGAVVDLEWSGTEGKNGLFALGWNVTVMFSPDGSVDHVENNGRYTPTVPIYFLVGRWERISALGIEPLDPSDPHYDPACPDPQWRPLVEDGLWNYQDATNAWVSINPTSGLVTTAEVNTPTDYLVGDQILWEEMVDESREFARMSKRNTGGR